MSLIQYITKTVCIVDKDIDDLVCCLWFERAITDFNRIDRLTFREEDVMLIITGALLKCYMHITKTIDPDEAFHTFLEYGEKHAKGIMSVKKYLDLSIICKMAVFALQDEWKDIHILLAEIKKYVTPENGDVEERALEYLLM